MAQESGKTNSVAYALSSTDHGPQYFRSARNGGIIGGLIGSGITMIVCLVCHYFFGV